MSITFEKFKRAFFTLTQASWSSDSKAANVSPAHNQNDFDRNKILENLNESSLAAIKEPQNIFKNISLKGNIENFIGVATVPIGLAGPLLIKGDNALGYFNLPLATTEGALVASYSRGAKACSINGGAKTFYVDEGVQRSPVFMFDSCNSAIDFQNWVLTQSSLFPKIVKEVSRFAKFKNLQTLLEGNQLILTFHFTTGDAAGQNMVTICTQAICEYLIENSAIKIKQWYIESNFAGDKKATNTSLTGTRGRKVIAEVVLSKNSVSTVLKSSPKAMVQYFQSHLMATIQSGTVGAQGHYANGLAAIFLATGQDLACVSEASIGMTRFQLTDEGDLYVSVSMPNLIVGTVGGGTRFPSQRACLDLLGCKNEGDSRKLAEIIAATILCGEISITAALAEGHFTKAHQALGRPNQESRS